MCTALSWDGLFGRNLDLEYAYDESVTITPRRFPFHFQHVPAQAQHYALLGMAYVADGYPLYYDAVNETGLAMAGLRFAHSACYGDFLSGKTNLAAYELIPWLLGSCQTLAEAKNKLQQLRITKDAFSTALPPAPLHWLLADQTGSLVIEQDETGLHLYDDPVGVLTNEPPFSMQMQQLALYIRLSPEPPENTLIPEVPLPVFSRGMGALGLPGDLSSPSRFVRAVFTRRHAVSGKTDIERLQQFFHILGAVSQTRGCVQLPEGGLEYTRYACCCDCARGVYYYKTYENSQLHAVDLHRVELDSTQLTSYPLRLLPEIHWQN